MSRKKNNLPVDTGGLDLTLAPAEDVMADVAVVTTSRLDAITAAEEPAIDVTAAPSNAHKAVEELESLPPAVSLADQITGNVTDHDGRVIGHTVGGPYMQVPGDLDNCVFLVEALHMSSLWLAVRKTNLEDVLVISNGTRFWTVDTKKLEPLLANGVISPDGFRQVAVWRPVAGNERGWYVG